MHIRGFVRNDGDDVWHLHNLALEETGAHLGNGVWDQDVRDPTTFYLQVGGEFLVAEYEGELVAMGAFLPKSEDTVEIKRMRVHPSYQRRGIARKLLGQLEYLAIKRGFRKAVLDTTTIQSAAQSLYLEAGYSIVGNGRVGPFKIVLFEKMLPSDVT